MNQSNAKEGSSSCQCTMTSDWGNRGNKDNCLANALRVTEYARRFTQGHWSFLGPGFEKKWCGTHVNKPDGEWDKTAENMMLNFAENGHPACRASSALERGELKSKGKGVKTIHFNGSDETIELIFRTVLAVNQLKLSVCGAEADLFKELVREPAGVGKPAASDTDRISYCQPYFLGLMPKYNESCCVNTSRNSQNFLNNRN